MDKKMTNCAKCNASTFDRMLHRVNPKGEKGIWWCMSCIEEYEPELAKNIEEDRTEVDRDLEKAAYSMEGEDMMISEPTLEQLEAWFNEIITKKLKEGSPGSSSSPIVWYQYCQTYGWVKRSEKALDLCGSEGCTSCKHIQELIEKHLKDETTN